MIERKIDSTLSAKREDNTGWIAHVLSAKGVTVSTAIQSHFE